MNLTRIEKKNAEYFDHLCPMELLSDETLESLGVVDNNEAACVCVVEVVENLLDIIWFYTDPDKREAGVATYMMANLTMIAEDLGLKGIMINFPSGSEGMVDFLIGRGFFITDDDGFYSVPVSDIIYSKGMDKITESASDSDNVFFLSDKEGMAIYKTLIKTNAIDPMILEGVSEDLSVFYRDAKEKKVTAVFVTRSGDNLCVNYLLGYGSVRGICEVLNALVKRIISMDLTAGNLVFADRSGKAVQLIENLTGNDREVYVVPDRRQAVMLFA